MKLTCIIGRLSVFVILIMSFASCANYKNIAYFKDISDSSSLYETGKEVKTATYHPLIIQPDDNLQILISTIDPQTDNSLNLSFGGDGSLGSGKAGGGLNIANNIDGYLVDKQGDIELPVIGTIHVAGMTTNEVKNIVYEKATKLFKQPVVNVRLSNFKVTVLGEVTRPGTYTIDGERANLLDALGLAGDMTIYGKRENVLLMRMENGDKKMVARFNLNDRNTLSSPYFYLRQGDIIYVEPNKGKAAATDMSTTKTYAIVGSLLSVIIVIISRL